MRTRPDPAAAMRAVVAAREYRRGAAATATSVGGLTIRRSLHTRLPWHTHQNDAASMRKLLEEDGALVNARD